MFEPIGRREIILVRRPTPRRLLKQIVAQPISCLEAVAIYDRGSPWTEDDTKRLGAHLVAEGPHDPECPTNDPMLRYEIAEWVRTHSPSSS